MRPFFEQGTQSPSFFFTSRDSAWRLPSRIRRQHVLVRRLRHAALEPARTHTAPKQTQAHTRVRAREKSLSLFVPSRTRVGLALFKRSKASRLVASSLRVGCLCGVVLSQVGSLLFRTTRAAKVSRISRQSRSPILSRGSRLFFSRRINPRARGCVVAPRRFARATVRTSIFQHGS